MKNAEFSPEEQSIIRQCIAIIIVEYDLIEDPEFQTRLGVTRLEVYRLTADWPILKEMNDSPKLQTAINNCLNEVCNALYISDKTWNQYFDFSVEEVQTVCRKWFALRKAEKS